MFQEPNVANTKTYEMEDIIAYWIIKSLECTGFVIEKIQSIFLGNKYALEGEEKVDEKADDNDEGETDGEDDEDEDDNIPIYDADYSIYENILYSIEKQSIRFSSVKDIYVFVIDFFVQNTLLMDDAMVSKIVISVALQHNLISAESYYNIYFRGLNELIWFEENKELSEEGPDVSLNDDTMPMEIDYDTLVDETRVDLTTPAEE